MHAYWLDPEYKELANHFDMEHFNNPDRRPVISEAEKSEILDLTSEAFQNRDDQKMAHYDFILISDDPNFKTFLGWLSPEQISHYDGVYYFRRDRLAFYPASKNYTVEIFWRGRVTEAVMNINDKECISGRYYPQDCKYDIIDNLVFRDG